MFLLETKDIYARLSKHINKIFLHNNYLIYCKKEC